MEGETETFLFYVWGLVCMGNADLRDIAIIDDDIELEDLEGQVLTVDAHNWLYKYMTITVQYTDTSEYTTNDGVELPTLFGAIQGGKRFFEHSITPIFVFDGSYHSLKEGEVQDRAQKKQEAEEKRKKAEEEGSYIEAAKYDSRSTRLTSEMIEETKTVFDLLGFEYITAPASGESQAAYMAQRDEEIDGIVSDDYDALLFKSPSTVRNFTQPKNLERMDFSETLEEHNITHEQLIDIAILCGTDYNDGITGYGPKTSIKAVKENSFEEILDDNEISGDLREKLVQVRDLFLDPDVTDNYSYSPLMPVPKVDEIGDHIKELGISYDSLETSLEDIREYGTQSGLSDWS